MSFTTEEINALAAEARLMIAQEELPEIIRYMDGFLSKLERLNGLELKDVPLFDFAETNSCPMRDDNIIEYQYRGDILAAAPEREGDYYRAARILE